VTLVYNDPSFKIVNRINIFITSTMLKEHTEELDVVEQDRGF